MKISAWPQGKILFGVWAIQGGIALCWLLIIPTDTENPFAFGFSLARLIVVGITFVPSAIFALLSLKYHILNEQPAWLNLKQRAGFLDILYVAALLTVLSTFSITIGFDLLHHAPAYPVFSAYAARVYPFLSWVGISGLELAVFIGWSRYRQTKNSLSAFRPVIANAILLFLAFCLVGLLVVATGIGITPEDNWGGPPVPYFEWQILLSLLVVGVVALLMRTTLKINDAWFPPVLYLFTVALWLSQPVNPGYLATPPRAPNYEIYPFSDPQFYAQYAQSALTGNGFLWPEVPARPFYVAVLTWLHLFGNQNYNQVIALQSLVLAFFPVLLYLLGKEIGGWPVGLALSLLTIFRDINSNGAVLIANNVTYSKLFLSELPAALLISLAALLSLIWVRHINRLIWYPLLIGGVLGVATLIRLQIVALAGVVILLTFFIIPDRKQWLNGAFLIVAGLALTIVPWISRNYFAAGGLILDNPISQTMTMARRWSGNTGNDILPPFPNENDAQYSSRLTRMAIESLKQNPEFILKTTANHFINSEIASLLAFPIRDKIISPSELVRPEHAFWKTPLTIKQTPFFAIHLLLFSLGLVAAWRRLYWMGLLPLGFGLVYNLWSALFFSSGVRFIVPVDWSVHLYQLFGLTILCSMLISFTETGRDSSLNWLHLPIRNNAVSPISPLVRRRQIVACLTLLIFMGGFTPVTEFIFPQKYPPKAPEEILQQAGLTVRAGELALYGRAIYPRYYESGEGEPGTAKLGYGRSDQARLIFFLLGSNQGLVIFELENAPEFFPHASDVFMVGTQTNGYFSPRVVVVTKDSRTETYEIDR